MSAKQCLAFVTEPSALAWSPDLELVEYNGVLAVLGPQSPRLRVTRKAMLQDVVVRMSRLEELMSHGTVLPALADVALTPDQALIALRANQSVLQRAAGQLRGKVQFQMCIRWDDLAALGHFQTGSGPFEAVDSLEDLGRRFQHWVDDQLAALGAETLALPVAAGVAVNRAILLPTALLPGLDAVTEAIDALWSEGLSIRLTGPSPGMSFASLAMRPLRPAMLQDALVRLGLRFGATPDEIRTARRRALLAAGATSASMVTRYVEVVQLAAAAGWPMGSIPELSIWAEDRAGPERLRGAA